MFIVTIAVGVQDRPASAPQTTGPWSSDWKAVGDPTFAQAIAAVSNLLFAFSGTPGESTSKGFWFYSGLTFPFRLFLNCVRDAQSSTIHRSHAHLPGWCDCCVRSSWLCHLLLLWHVCVFASAWLGRWSYQNHQLCVCITGITR